MYFASLNIFDERDMKIAGFLGIGLIGIEGKYPNFVCNRVLDAPTNVAITEMRDYVLGYKGVLQCESCKVFQHYQSNEYVVTEKSWGKLTNWAEGQVTKKGKGLRMKKKDRKELYCNKCAKNELKRKNNLLSEEQRMNNKKKPEDLEFTIDEMLSRLESVKDYLSKEAYENVRKGLQNLKQK